MTMLRSFRRMAKEAERASKRQHVDPAEFPKPRRPWLDLEVGQSFKVPKDEVQQDSLGSSGREWSRRTGRVFSVTRTQTHWVVTRTA